MITIRHPWLAKSWNESKHRRGHQGNAGQFSSTAGGSGKAKPAPAPGSRHNPDLDAAMGFGEPAATDSPRHPSRHNPDITYGNRDDQVMDDRKLGGRARAAKQKVEAIKAKLAEVEASYAATVKNLKAEAAKAIAAIEPKRGRKQRGKIAPANGPAPAAPTGDQFADYQPGTQDLKQHPGKDQQATGSGYPAWAKPGEPGFVTGDALNEKPPAAKTAVTPPALPQRTPKPGPPPLPAKLQQASPPALPHHRTQQTALSAAQRVAQLSNGGDPQQLAAAHAEAKQHLAAHLAAGLAELRRRGDHGRGAEAFRAKIQAVAGRLDAMAKQGQGPLPQGKPYASRTPARVSSPGDHHRGGIVTRRKGLRHPWLVAKSWADFDLSLPAVIVARHPWLRKEWVESAHKRGQPENAGEFTSGGGGKKKPAPPKSGKSNNAAMANESGDKYEEQARKIVGGKLKKVKERAWTGEPQGEPISKDLAGAIGEEVLIQYLKSIGYDDAGKTSALVGSAMNNLPFDLIHDHQLIEAKGGQTGKPSGLWQLKYDGRFSKEQEAAFAKLKKPEKIAALKKAINADKVRRIHERKAAFVAELSKKMGFKVKPGMMTVIINHETKTADIYKFDGLHDRIPWNSEMAQNGYVATVRYG